MAINYGLLDTTIPAQIGAVPANALAMAFKTRQQGTENALADLQLKKAQQDMADEAAFRTALGGVQGGDYGAAMPALVQASPTRAIALQKTLDEGQKNKLDVTLKRFDVIDRTANQFAANPTRQMGVWVLSQLAQNGTPPEVIKQMSDKLNATPDADLPKMAQAFLGATQEGMKAHVASLYPKPAQPSDLARLMAERDRAAAAGDAAGVAAYDAEISKTRVAQTETERHHRALEAMGLGGGVTLSPEAIRMLAQKGSVTGEIPTVGRGRAAAAAQIKIANEMAAQDAGVDLAGAKAGFHANQASLQKLQTQADAVNAFERTAMSNLDTFLQKAHAGIPDTGSPLFNMGSRTFAERVRGDPKMTELNVARQVAVQEVGKVLSGAIGNAAISDSARHEVEQLLSPDATITQIEAAAGILRADMNNRKAAMQAELANVRARTAGKEKPASEPAAASTPSPPRAGPRAPARISNDAEYNALPSGAEFVGPDGKLRRKP